MFHRLRKIGFGLCLLCAASLANAAPTVNNFGDTIVHRPKPHTSRDPSQYASPLVRPVQAVDSHLASFAQRLLNPPGAEDSSRPSSRSVRSLPASPAAILMALAGFLCVSIVKDRRLWLAALMTLLWISQASIQAVPKLAGRSKHSNHGKWQPHTNLQYYQTIFNRSSLCHDLEPSLAAIITGQHRPDAPTCRRLLWPGQFNCFWPAFIFENLPRGPPKLA